MKKLTLVALIVLSSHASAEGVYLRGNAGASISNEQVELGEKKSEFDKSPMLGVAVGYQLSPNFALEGDFRYRKLKVEEKLGGSSIDLDGKAYSLMANGIYQFDMGNVAPYVKAGIGATKASGDLTLSEKVNSKTSKTTFSGKSDTTLAWALGAGTDIKLTKSLSLNFDYQYLKSSNRKLDKKKKKEKEGFSTGTLDYKAHEITAGFRFDF